MSNIRKLINAIAEAKFYLSWNLISRFWQIEIEKKNKLKMAFSTSWGYYEYNIMTFEFKKALAIF